MIIVTVERYPDNGIETHSEVLIYDGEILLFQCCGLELPWKNNEKRISCIPLGEYDCEKRNATPNIPYQHVLIKDIPNRDGVCIHKSNFVSQLKGCLALGDKRVDINGDGRLDVTNSGRTFDRFMSIVPDKFKLTIK